MSDPNDPMAEIRASFFIECEELLEAAQDGLQTMQDGAADDETINQVFRAVHSIKGGAGAFGLEELVSFAHQYETALDDVRSGKFTPNEDAMLLFLGCCDLLADLVDSARDGTDMDAARVESLLTQLRDVVGIEEEEEVSADEFEVTGISFDLDLPDLPDADAEPAPTPVYDILFAPNDDLYGLGNEPLFLIRALAALGELELQCDYSAIPDIEQFIPGTAYMSWSLTLETDAPEADIHEVFEFVDGLGKIEIREQGAPPSDPTETTEADEIAQNPNPPAEAELQAPASAGSDPAPDQTGTEPSSEEAVPPAQAALTKKPQKSNGDGGKGAPATVRVDLERIDRLVNLVGELVINQAMLSQSVTEADLPPNSAVAHGLEEFMQLTRDIQDSVMMIRAQPVKSLFQRMSRIIREASGAVGKTVRLRTEGEATEVDKTVIERLADPLTHMIRNAVDHGLESTDARVAAGKPPEGIVSLTAAHRSGRVVIEVSDDGGGINRPKVFDIAVSKGLIPADAQLTDSEIDNLLFLPGFSTATEVSNLSGRGVGMDVVRSAIQALGGRIVIQSEPGTGTTFSISLPLTLAVLDGMVVQVAGETLVVPLNAIIETLTLAAEDIRALGPETNVVQIRGQFVPLLDLGAELGFREPLESYVGGIVLLIAHENGDRAALVVDSIHDQRQVVIKGLQDSYGHVPGVAAATILGDGQIALILDPVDITAHASGRTNQAAPALSNAG
ncbi:MAG: chemotaxis protein CheA [Mangrovicoccus sp.]|nr:chemotaxis protein CheA [Mangrovicoccus sp.]